MVVALIGATGAATVGAQGTRRTVWSGTVGERQVVVDERWTPPFMDIMVSVRVSAAGRTSAIEISTAGTSPDLVAPSGTERLVLIAGGMASIVNLGAELVVDQFLVSRPSISPDGRFIAYRRDQPRQSREEDVLLLYDVSRNPQVNRLPPSGAMEVMRDVGLPVFPQWHATTRTYQGRDATADAPAWTLRSPIAWATSTAFVFLTGPTAPGASLAIHHVDVRDGAQRPVVRSQTLDMGTVTSGPLPDAREIELLECAASGCQAQIEWMPTEGLRAPASRITF